MLEQFHQELRENKEMERFCRFHEMATL